MRAPAPSLRPTTGAPTLRARSISLWIFSANTSPRAPPKTVKSCENTNTLRPSTVPQPVMTPSVYGRSSIPVAFERWRASRSSSLNEPSSRRYSMRSRASSLPLACWRSTERADPAWYASSRRFCRSSSLSCMLLPVTDVTLLPAPGHGPMRSGARSRARGRAAVRACASSGPVSDDALDGVGGLVGDEVADVGELDVAGAGDQLGQAHPVVDGDQRVLGAVDDGGRHGELP